MGRNIQQSATFSGQRWRQIGANDLGKLFGLEIGNKIKKHKTCLEESWLNDLRIEPPALKFLGSRHVGI